MARVNAFAIAAALALTIIMTPVLVTATQPSDISKDTSVKTEPLDKAPPLYSPPRRGAPVGRVGGGTRAGQAGLPRLEALAPDHTGLTVHSGPTLYWYLSEPTPHPIEFTLIDNQAIDPLVERRITPERSSGIQAIALTDLNVQLSPGVPYQWFVALIPDSGQRSRDIVAGGLIERITTSKQLKERLAAAAPTEQWAVYAEFGLWYDALMTLSESITQAPDSRVLQDRRRQLLEQVGLTPDYFNNFQ